MSPTSNQAFEMLSSPRRRYAIRVLGMNGRMDRVDLIRRVAIMENGEDAIPAKSDNDVYKRVYVSMVQTHIPRLESCELIEIDDGVVIPSDEAKKLHSVVKQVTSRLG